MLRDRLIDQLRRTLHVDISLPPLPKRLLLDLNLLLHAVDPSDLLVNLVVLHLLLGRGVLHIVGVLLSQI